ncbi:MAG: hypothetical protein ACXAD7_05825 [Candidatus Kariarchaeaceae archaeon]
MWNNRMFFWFFLIISLLSIIAYVVYGFPFPFFFLFLPPFLFRKSNRNQVLPLKQQYIGPLYCEKCGIKIEQYWQYCPICAEPTRPNPN